MENTTWNQQCRQKDLNDNSCSILEAFTIAEGFTGKAQQCSYVDENRIGDHICYYSDLRKMKAHYPGWESTQGLEETIRQIMEAWMQGA